jgi:hypothetical protein
VEQGAGVLGRLEQQDVVVLPRDVVAERAVAGATRWVWASTSPGRMVAAP